MKLKRSPMALAALVVLAGISLPQAVDARGGHGGGGRGGGGHGGGYSGGGHHGGGHGGGYSGGGHHGGGYGGGHRGGGGYSGGGHHPGAHGGGNYGIHSYGGGGKGHGAAYPGYGVTSYSFGHYARQNSYGISQVPPTGQPSRPARYGSAQQRMTFASNVSWQHAALTRHNAFFFRRSGFGDNRNRWRDHYWFGYPWYRSIFWPYIFGDYFSYIIWPIAYSDTFWGYGPDVILLGALWPNQQTTYSHSSDLYDNAGVGSISLGQSETCSGFAPGISDLPVRHLEKIIDATPGQRAALTDLKAAAEKASNILKQSCPSETPLTPLARLDAMQQRLQAMQEASDAIKAPLLHLYSLLSDTQKQQLEASVQPKAPQGREVQGKGANAGKLCGQQAEFMKVPVDQIAGTIKLSDAQKQELEKLKDVSAQASTNLKESCPSGVADTIERRLDAAQMRIKALSQAIDTVRPVMREFYASLTDEQKAALLVPSARQTARR